MFSLEIHKKRVIQHFKCKPKKKEAINYQQKMDLRQPTVFKLRALLRHHQPEEIYDYLFKTIGEVSVLIKKRHAIISIPSQQSYDKILNNYKVIRLFGKKLQFFPYKPDDDLIALSELPENGDISSISEMIEQSQKKSKFKPLNPVDEMIYNCQQQMQKSFEQFFTKLIKISHQRVDKLSFQIRDIDLLEREILALKDGLKKKIDEMEEKTQNKRNFIKGFVERFSAKMPQEIEIEPSFRVENNFQFPEITLENSQFKCHLSFVNQVNSSCKRLCAINKNQFAVTGCESGSPLKGFLKIFDVDNCHSKESFFANEGASGLEIVGSVIFVGTSMGNFQYLNLQEDNRQLQSTGIVPRKHEKIHSDMIQIVRTPSTSSSCSKFLTLCKDNVIRQFEMSNEEIMPGTFSQSFQEQFSYDCAENCRSLQILKQNVFAFGVSNQIVKYQLGTDRKKSIPIKGFPTKIKKHNQNVFAISIDQSVQMIDTRSETIVQKFIQIRDHHNKDLNISSLQSISDHCLFYGANGQIGMLDDRRCQFIRWSDVKMHKGSVTDIVKLSNKVVSCDFSGNICSWSLKLF